MVRATSLINSAPFAICGGEENSGRKIRSASFSVLVIPSQVIDAIECPPTEKYLIIISELLFISALTAVQFSLRTAVSFLSWHIGSVLFSDRSGDFLYLLIRFPSA